MNWQRLDRENTLKTIDSVKSASEAALFSPTTSEVQRARLSFYEGIDLYKLTNFASLPSFTFEYLGDGTFFQYLDGTEIPIYTINDKGRLTLDDRSVVDYLEFFFAHVMVDDEETFFIHNARDMPLLDSLDDETIDVITRNHKSPSVQYDAGFDKFTVEADLYSDGLLIRATIEVTSSGRVTVLNRNMIVNALALAPGIRNNGLGVDMTDKETTGLGGTFGAKTKGSQIGYGHPYGKEILDGILSIIKESKIGQTLINVHTMYKFPIQIIKGTGESGFSAPAKIIYLQIPGSAKKAEAKYVVSTVKALREAEQEIIGFTAPDPAKDFMKYASVMHAKNLDSVVYACKVVKELTNTSHSKDLLDALKGFGYSDVYKAYISNASEKELFDAYEGK